MFISHANSGDQVKTAYIISNVYVDVTAKTASAARRKALAEGEKAAFKLLLKRLTRRIDHKRLPEMAGDKISGYVRDFSVSNEKNSQVRYLANLTYRFKPHAIRQFLRDSEIPFAETLSKSVLLLPVYQVAGAVALWDNPNPWRKAWEDRFKGEGVPKTKQSAKLVPMIFGNGDLTDIAMISAELAFKGDVQRLSAIAKRYGVAATLVVFGSLSSDMRGQPMLEVNISGGGTRNFKAFSTKIKANKGEGVDALLDRSVSEINSLIEDKWKHNNLLEFGRVGVVAVTLPINELIEWVDAKRRLTNVAVIETSELVLISRTEVRLNIHFIGGTKQLKLALDQVGILLEEQDGSWMMLLQPNVDSSLTKSVTMK
jgi:hypothetical protein